MEEETDIFLLFVANIMKAFCVFDLLMYCWFHFCTNEIFKTLLLSASKATSF